MIRNHIRIALVLLIVGLIAVGSIALQPAIPYSAPRFSNQETPVATDTPVPEGAHAFDDEPPIGLRLLDEHAEVLFDIAPTHTHGHSR